MKQNPKSLDPAESRSRYRATGWASFEAQGRSVRWRLPRILPALEDAPTTGRAAGVRTGERLDQLSARVLGDPTAYWLLTDANPSLDPLRFVDEHPQQVEMPVPRVPR